MGTAFPRVPLEMTPS